MKGAPTIAGVIEAQLQRNGSLTIDDHNIVMVDGPIEAGEMGVLRNRTHRTLLSFMHPHARVPVLRRAGTVALAGRSALRRCDRRRRRGRIGSSLGSLGAANKWP